MDCALSFTYGRGSTLNAVECILDLLIIAPWLLFSVTAVLRMLALLTGRLAYYTVARPRSCGKRRDHEE